MHSKALSRRESALLVFSRLLGEPARTTFNLNLPAMEIGGIHFHRRLSRPLRGPVQKVNADLFSTTVLFPPADPSRRSGYSRDRISSTKKIFDTKKIFECQARLADSDCVFRCFVKGSARIALGIHGSDFPGSEIGCFEPGNVFWREPYEGGFGSRWGLRPFTALRGCLKSHDLVNRLSMRRIAIRSISVSEVCTRCS
jgi:hypothetical protein